jgi:hypothetical protein
MSPSVGKGEDRDVDDARAQLIRLVRTLPLTRWQVELDGRDLSGDYLLVEALNMSCVGPNVCVAQHGHRPEGHLDVVLAGDGEREALRALNRPGELGSVLLPHTGQRLTLWCRRKELHVDHTYGKDLRAPKGPIRVEVEPSGQGVDVLV